MKIPRRRQDADVARVAVALGGRVRVSRRSPLSGSTSAGMAAARAWAGASSESVTSS